jgi:hypothetical protein
MSLTVPTASRNAMCNALVDLLDVGSGQSTGDLRFYTASFATLLATLLFSNPAFGDRHGDGLRHHRGQLRRRQRHGRGLASPRPRWHHGPGRHLRHQRAGYQLQHGHVDRGR